MEKLSKHEVVNRDGIFVGFVTASSVEVAKELLASYDGKKRGYKLSGKAIMLSLPQVNGVGRQRITKM
jgi:hypothetical protein